MPTTTEHSSLALSRLRDRLTQETRAEVYFDRGQRSLYATDASLYQIEPVGVVVPRTVEDVIATVRIAASEHVAIVPRGAATSLSGQTIGAAIVIDFSKYLNRIGVVDRDAMTVRVEPGVVLDQLNANLKPLGLMFGPDVSTSDRATIGGMIGNNSAGARSLRYGKTVDHVLAVEVVFADGTPARLGPVSEQELTAIILRKDTVGRVHRVVRDTVDQHRKAIRERFPHILRRVSGYNLDEFVPGLPVRPAGWAEEALRQTKIAGVRERNANAQRLAVLSAQALADKPQRCLILAVEAIRATRDHGKPLVPDAEQGLRSALAVVNGRPILRQTSPITALATPMALRRTKPQLRNKGIYQSRSRAFRDSPVSYEDRGLYPEYTASGPSSCHS